MIFTMLEAELMHVAERHNRRDRGESDNPNYRGSPDTAHSHNVWCHR
ncbi:hypothetical protein [Nonomuraea phyllanthi]|nr:hypothetical protein [Nonomuraea phyllanthi]